MPEHDCEDRFAFQILMLENSNPGLLARKRLRARPAGPSPGTLAGTAELAAAVDLIEK